MVTGEKSSPNTEHGDSELKSGQVGNYQDARVRAGENGAFCSAVQETDNR